MTQPADAATSQGSRTSTEAVRFLGRDGVVLAGFVVTPRAPGRYPGIVLIPDVGDRAAQELRPLAKALAREGIVSLIYDKRGVGDSGGNWRGGDYQEFATDTLAGVQLLLGHSAVEPARVGVLGIGEGGWVAPLAARSTQTIAFVVTIGAPCARPIDQERYRRVMQLRQAGTSRLFTALYQAVWLLATTIWQEFPDATATDHGFFTRVCAHNPLADWQRVTQPVLALWGSRDDRVPPRGSTWLARRVLQAPHQHACIVQDADHLLHGTGQDPATADRPLLERLLPWLRQVFPTESGLAAPAAQRTPDGHWQEPR